MLVEVGREMGKESPPLAKALSLHSTREPGMDSCAA